MIAITVLFMSETLRSFRVIINTRRFHKIKCIFDRLYFRKIAAMLTARQFCHRYARRRTSVHSFPTLFRSLRVFAR